MSSERVTVSEIREFRRQLRRRGGALAVAGLVTGFSTTATLVVAAPRLGAGAVSALALAGTISAILTLIFSGFALAVVRHGAHAGRSGPDANHGASSAGEPFWALAIAAGVTIAVVLTALALVIGALFPTERLLAWALLLLVPQGLVVPAQEVLIGLQQAAGADRRILSNALTGLAFRMAGAVAVVVVPCTDIAGIALLGGAGIAAAGWTLRRELASLLQFTSRRRLAAGFRNGLREFLGTPLRTVRRVPGATAGSYDGLVQLVSFATVLRLATLLPAAEAASTAIGITALRSLVLPLKQVGLVAGRLIVRMGHSPGERTTLLGAAARCAAPATTALSVGCLLTAASGTALSFLPHAAAIVLCMVGAQTLVEPVTGVTASALRVLLSPTATTGSLALIMWAGVLPALAIQAGSGHLTLWGLWSTLLAARLGYAAVVVTKYPRRTHLAT